MQDHWLTYDEAARLLGVKPDSVRRQARAKSWPRQTGNDGKARVRIPPERLEDHRAAILPAVIPSESPPELPPDQSARIAALEARLEAAEKRGDTAEADRDRWREMAEALRTDLVLERSRPVGLIARLFGR